MAHVKAFKMNFELRFEENETLMAKEFPTALQNDGLNGYFSFRSKLKNIYGQLIYEFYMHFKHHACRQVIICNLIHTK